MANIIPNSTTVITGLQEVAHDDTLSGTGTVTDPLSVAVPASIPFELPILKLDNAGMKTVSITGYDIYCSTMKATILNRDKFDAVTLVLERKKVRVSKKTHLGIFTHTVYSGFCEPVKERGVTPYITRWTLPDAITGQSYSSVTINNFDQFISHVYPDMSNNQYIRFYRSNGKSFQYIQFRFKIIFEKDGKKYEMTVDRFRIKSVKIWTGKINSSFIKIVYE
ncbi:MAG: hypothetical protein LBB41_06010 [Prevotellaceae bacterium]|jgi:hypothetical protein|nr:hypothetical protein [Prevotellaceae bacterium]